jgi:hypothetical protein
MLEIIRYEPSLVIKNLASLPRGTGARYLEVITSHIQGEYIAKKWHRRAPDKGLLVAFINPKLPNGGLTL